MKITVIYEIEPKEIANTLCTALEGGSLYWISDISKLGYTHKGALDLPAVFTEDETSKVFEITEEKIQVGLVLVAKRYPKIFAEEFLENENDYNGDANSADVFLQMCVFGKLVYG